MANHALDEKQKNAQPAPNGEIWLIRNDFKMPYTDQLSVGIRQAVFSWNVEVVGSFLYGKNQFEWFSGNRDLNGGDATQGRNDPPWGGAPGVGKLGPGGFVGEAPTRPLLFPAGQPYTRGQGG